MLLTDVCTSRALVTCPVVDHCKLSELEDMGVAVNNATMAIALTLVVLTIVNNVCGKAISNVF